MIFNEIYNTYYTTVAKIISAAVDGELTKKRMEEIVHKYAFSESFMQIIPALENEEWQLIHKDYTTPVMHKPQMPMTILQKRWLKAICNDKRFKLFGIEISGLEGVEPLYHAEDIIYTDVYSDGDDYSDEGYIERFRTILRAIEEKRKLNIEFVSHKNNDVRGTYIPYKLEYSEKDDKFRLLTENKNGNMFINLGRIIKCKTGDFYNEDEYKMPELKKREIILSIHIIHYLSHF